MVVPMVLFGLFVVVGSAFLVVFFVVGLYQVIRDKRRDVSTEKQIMSIRKASIR
jgi:hypothetical protein